MSALEPALFYLHDENEKLKGVISLHVDDAFIAGEGPMFDASLTALEKALDLTFKYGEFVYCGKTVNQDDDYSITVTQPDASMAVEKINLTRQRRKELDQDATPSELTELRSVVGSLGWVARQTRADLAYVQSRLAQRVSRATVGGLAGGQPGGGPGDRLP